MTDIYTDGNAAPATPAAAVVTPPAAFEVPADLQELVGQGKKYATVEAALRSIAPAQAHIAKLEQEAEAARQALSAAGAVDDVRKTIEDLLKPSVDKPAALDEAALASLVDGRLAAAATARQEQQNVAAFKGELDKAYGDKAKEKFDATAAANDLTPAELSALVKRSPNAALKLFDLKAPAARHLASDVNALGLTQNPDTIPAYKSIMRGSTTRDLVSQVQRARALVAQDLKGA